MNLVKIIEEDYQRFPENQTYGIYAEDVHFKDPVYDFRGLKKYQEMIGFLKKWFANLRLELHEIEQCGDQINTRWTMSWNSPLPWKPFISVSGRSELKLKDNLIVGHYDYWDKSFWHMIKQHFPFQ
ncbi:DUF2358 domain-containing protein [Cyanobacterium stanieri LEGE 03274]|uniref:DUF2358 domain-containing protein n=1 Tax=Cyanobacterium stanieri LEGE 03274 TaxID=1828756 RepID=A0ABR9V4G9_9CHRO|nr:DUF2358 domain-containing protein [Cyanobacterium stanieri]MBE9222791.1 DUF2358 domain-containing protein [Cyanobacterium stanieri LEGE 03274]